MINTIKRHAVLYGSPELVREDFLEKVSFSRGVKYKMVSRQRGARRTFQGEEKACAQVESSGVNVQKGGELAESE